MVLVPADPHASNGAPYSDPIDLTGRMPATVMDVFEQTEANEEHQYPSAPFYKSLYDWSNSADEVAQDFHAGESRYNSVCFQEHQYVYSPQTQMLTTPIAGSGHLGSVTYPGCAVDRTHGMREFRETDRGAGPSSVMIR